MRDPLQPFPTVPEDEFGGLSGADESDGLHPFPHHRRHDLHRFPEGTSAVATGQGLRPPAPPLQQWRVPEGEKLAPSRRAVPVHQGHLRPTDAGGMLLGVGDGGRRSDELGTGAVVSADAAETTNRVGHVGAEDAPVGVHFVEDDVAQVGEEAVPAGVVREDALVEHVGVGQDDVPLVPEPPTDALGRIAVVGASEEIDV